MGLIKMNSSKASVGKLENYLKQPEKTKEQLQTGLNCDIRHLSYEFKETKLMYNKDDGRRYYHLIQSFHTKDNISPDKAHEIGVKLAEKQFGSKGFEVGIITHTDKAHTHNHIVINSINAKTGKKFKSKAKDLWRIKENSNELCKEYNLKHSYIDHTKRTVSYDRGEFEAVKRGNSWKANVIKDIKETLSKQPTTMQELINQLEEKDYSIKYKKSSKTITFTTPEGKKVRGKTLTKSYEDLDYSKGALENEIKRYREISTTKERIGTRANRTINRKQEIERTDEKLYNSSNGPKHNKENDVGKRVDRHQKSITRNTKENDFDFEKARKHVRSEQQSTTKDFGKWNNRLEREHKQGLDGNAIDREQVRERNKELEQSKSKELKHNRTKNIDLSR
jgi:hypothetical protein